MSERMSLSGPIVSIECSFVTANSGQMYDSSVLRLTFHLLTYFPVTNFQRAPMPLRVSSFPHFTRQRMTRKTKQNLMTTDAVIRAAKPYHATLMGCAVFVGIVP